MKSIILIGFMGSGKTTVGKILSEFSGMPFVDTDELIEEKYKMSVSEIFEKFGEDEFRKREEETFKELVEKDEGYIIATGGGLPIFLKDKSLLNKGFTVYLETDIKTIFSRLENDTTRPLLSKGNKAKKIAELLEVRGPIYKNLAHTVMNGKIAPENIAKTILLAFNNLEI